MARRVVPVLQIIAVACLLPALLAFAVELPAQARIVEGRVTRPTPSGRPAPVAGQWVVLHRVGFDRAAPLDSARSARNGAFRFRYTPSGDADALYFVSSRYAGIAYFSPPLRSSVSGGDADIIVYDTTSSTEKLRVQGQHLVMSAPRGLKREIAEIYELENTDNRTLVARDSTTPLWTTTLPTAAESAHVAPGDITAGAVVFRQGRAELYAPISPGVRQLVMTYMVPADAFPLSVPIGGQSSLVEVLVEEPRATVNGARLAEVEPATIDGRTFRRFLSQDVPANAVFQIDAPRPVDPDRPAIQALAIVVGVVMVAAIGFWAAWRRRSHAAPAMAARPLAESEQLIAQLARLDSEHARAAEDAARKHSYETERAELKARIARALAAEQGGA